MARLFLALAAISISACNTLGDERLLVTAASALNEEPFVMEVATTIGSEHWEHEVRFSPPDRFELRPGTSPQPSMIVVGPEAWISEDGSTWSAASSEMLLFRIIEPIRVLKDHAQGGSSFVVQDGPDIEDERTLEYSRTDADWGDRMAGIVRGLDAPDSITVPLAAQYEGASLALTALVGVDSGRVHRIIAIVDNGFLVSSRSEWTFSYPDDVRVNPPSLN